MIKSPLTTERTWNGSFENVWPSQVLPIVKSPHLMPWYGAWDAGFPVMSYAHGVAAVPSLVLTANE